MLNKIKNFLGIRSTESQIELMLEQVNAEVSKSTAKKVSKKAPAKKAVVKKAPAKKAVSKKAPSKKTKNTK
jgi:uncharacterized protein YdbL (DUF1318 family)